MPEYLSPGVYVEEIEAGPQPIEGVSTSTTGAVGVTALGPSDGKPVLITSFADYTRIFGGYLAEPDPGVLNKWVLNPGEGGRWWQFPLSVRGFFENGGQRLYVKRVFAGGGGVQGKGAVSSEALFGKGLASSLVQDANAADKTISLQHLIDISVNAQINLFAADKAVPGNPFTVTAYDATAGTA